MSKYLFYAAALAAGSITGVAQQKIVKQVPARMIQSMEGADLYQEFCAVCHGAAAKGNGPAAGALKKSATDLTQLARKNGGKFPTLAVQTSIKGDNSILAHGSAAMPVWGSVFSQACQQKDLGDLRLMALLKYIESIQAK